MQLAWCGHMPADLRRVVHRCAAMPASTQPPKDADRRPKAAPRAGAARAVRCAAGGAPGVDDTRSPRGEPLECGPITVCSRNARRGAVGESSLAPIGFADVQCAAMNPVFVPLRRRRMADAAAWLSAGGTVGAVIVALFPQTRRVVWRPRLRIATDRAVFNVRRGSLRGPCSARVRPAQRVRPSPPPGC